MGFIDQLEVYVPAQQSACSEPRDDLSDRDGEGDQLADRYLHAHLEAVYEVSRQAPFRHLIAFSLDARTVHAHGQASCLRVLAFSVLAFFLPRRSPVTLAAGERRGRKNALP